MPAQPPELLASEASLLERLRAIGDGRPDSADPETLNWLSLGSHPGRWDAGEASLLA